MLSGKRRAYDIPATIGQASENAGGSIGQSKGIKKASTGNTEDVELEAPSAMAGGHQASAIIKALSAKQSSSAFGNPTNHTAHITSADALVWRGDAIVTFATSIAANQPVASILDRVKAFTKSNTTGGSNTKWQQFLEVEGRALPASGYFHSWVAHLIDKNTLSPGVDTALPNTTEEFGVYNFAGYYGERSGIRVQNVIKANPYTGVGASSAYLEDDGVAGFDRSPSASSERQLGQYYVGRSFGANISSLNASGVRGFLLAAPNDIDSGFTIKVGGRAYTSEEINDIEDRINLYMQSQQYSVLFGSFGAAVRGIKPPEDPFTGASVFLMSDVFREPADLEIVIGTAQAVQLVILTDDGIGAMTT